MRKRRTTIAVLISVAAILGIGGTLAYLNNVTETKKNTFTSNKKIDITLREPKWDGYNFTDPDSDGTKVNPNYNGNDILGLTQATNYVPGEKISKDPQVKNTGSQGLSVYTALGVKYYDNTNAQITYEEFKTKYLKASGISFHSNWQTVTGSDTGKTQFFVYNMSKPLVVGKTTEPLFEQVPLSLEIIPDADGKMPAFRIEVTAYAVQSDYIETSEATAELQKMVKANN